MFGLYILVYRTEIVNITFLIHICPGRNLIELNIPDMTPNKGMSGGREFCRKSLPLNSSGF